MDAETEASPQPKQPPAPFRGKKIRCRRCLKSPEEPCSNDKSRGDLKQ
jgi:hypothetical protein